mmetsp:Transcript_32904/g.60697  ORF Transcript_32904/g.60697 Transcript_32904/m.60697 type:complete len:245 (+) Transcript_32904:1181-1915(+)
MVIHTVNLANQHGQFHLNSSLVLLIGVIVLLSGIFKLLLHAVLSHLGHDLCQRLPGGREITTVGAPTGEKVHKHVGVRPQRNVEHILIEGHGILPVGVELLDGILNGNVEELHVVLLSVALPIPLANTLLIEVELLHVLRHVLLRAEDRDDVDGGEFALEIHHGDIEVDADLGFCVAVEGEVGFEGGREEGLGFEEEEEAHGEDGEGGEDGTTAGALEEVDGDLAVHVEGGKANHGGKRVVMVW